MTVSLTHAFASVKPASADPTIVDGPKWNDEHDLEMEGPAVLGKADAGIGPAVEVSAAQLSTLLNLDGKADTATQIIAGAGLTGGGDLSLDRTLNVGGSTSIIVGADDVQRAALTGDVTAPQNGNATTLATVNANVGSFGLAASVAQFVVNAKGLITAAANVAIQIAISAVTGLQAALDAKITIAATRTELAALDTVETTTAYLQESGREGVFQWIGSDLSARVTVDTQEGLYVAPTSDPTGASGAWVRQGNWVVNGASLFWFGALGTSTAMTTGSGANDTAAVQAAVNATKVIGVPIAVPSLPPTNAFRLTARIDIDQPVTFLGAGTHVTSLVTSGSTVNGPNGGSWFYLDHTGEGFFCRDELAVGTSKKFVRFKGVGTCRNQPTPAAAWAPTVHGADIRVEFNVDLDDFMFLNPYDAVYIRSAGVLTCQRVRGQPLFRGFRCERSSDAQRWKDVHFWPYWSLDTNVDTYTTTNSHCFRVNRADGLEVYSAFGIRYSRLFMLWDEIDTDGATQGFTFSGCYSDDAGGFIQIACSQPGSTRGCYGTIINPIVSAAPDGLGEGAAFIISGTNPCNVTILGLQCLRAHRQIINSLGSAHVVTCSTGRLEGWSAKAPGSFAFRAENSSQIRFLNQPIFIAGNGLHYQPLTGGSLIGPSGFVTAVPTVVASGVITVPSGGGLVTVDTEGAAPTDDLATINGGGAGDIIVLSSAHTDRDTTIQDGAGNIVTAGSFALANTTQTITLMNVAGIQWRELSRSAN